MSFKVPFQLKQQFYDSMNFDIEKAMFLSPNELSGVAAIGWAVRSA